MKNNAIPYGRQSIDKSDIKQVIQVLQSDFLTQGKSVPEFEKTIAEYCDSKYAVAYSSGTAALHGACFAADIGPGDEVITTPMTFVGSSNCVLYCGGTPVFADIKKTSPHIDPLEIDKKINSKTKAIIPVDYSGIPVDYAEIGFLAKKHDLIVIADAAHSLGALYKGKKVGSLSDMTVFSFHPVKTITTGEGGMVMTNNKKLYDRLVIFRTHGITKEKNKFETKNQGTWYYEMQELGYNYRMTDIQASLGISQMSRIGAFIKRRNEIAEKYKKAFKGNILIRTLEISNDRTSAWHLFPVLLKTRKLIATKKTLVEELRKQRIRVQIHYIPVHTHPFYQKQFDLGWGDFPNSEYFYKREISLPIFPTLAESEQEYVISTLIKLCQRIEKN